MTTADTPARAADTVELGDMIVTLIEAAKGAARKLNYEYHCGGNYPETECWAEESRLTDALDDIDEYLYGRRT